MDTENISQNQGDPTKKIKKSSIHTWLSEYRVSVPIIIPWLLVIILSIVIILIWSRGDSHRYQSMSQPRYFYHYTSPWDDIWYQHIRMREQFDRLWREHDRITRHQFPGVMYSSSLSQVSTKVNYSSSGVIGEIRSSDEEKLKKLQKTFSDAGMMIEGLDSGFIFSGSLDSYNSIQPIQF